MDIYSHVVKPILFQINPDLVHEAVTFTGSLLGKTVASRQILKTLYYFEHPSLEIEALGLKFKNPVG